jgi:hypothetical protein
MNNFRSKRDVKSKEIVTPRKILKISSKSYQMLEKYSKSLEEHVQDIKKSKSWLLDDMPKIYKAAKERMRSQIPYSPAHFLFGTQNPSLRLTSVSSSIVASVAGYPVTVISVTAGSLLNFSSLAAVFDEYRFIDVTFYTAVQVIEAASNTAPRLVAQVIDYDDSAVLASFDSALEYDTHKVICWDARASPGLHEEKAYIEHLPDSEWITTASASVVPVYLKFISDYNFSASANIGRTWYTATIQFRGQN